MGSVSALNSPIRYVAIGDSFTEGVGDNLPDGTVRGWADQVAQGVANATGETVLYANLAIRGRLLGRIIDEQLESALALNPTLVSFNGGGNDMLRPGTDLGWIIGRTRETIDQIRGAGVEPLLLAGPNPTRGLPGGGKVQLKGDTLVKAIKTMAAELDVKFTNNWADPELPKREYWASDRLHLASVGHLRVAYNVLTTLGLPIPEEWEYVAEPMSKPTSRDDLKYTVNYVLPWIGRRLTGRSSGDGRTGKYLDWVEVNPSAML